MPASYDNLMLVETAEKIYIYPAQFTSGSVFLVINRVTDEITIGRNQNEIPDGNRIRTICIGGIIGVINLIAGPYLVLIKTSVKVGVFDSHTIWRMNQFELVPFRRSLLHLSEKQIQYNQSYVEMIETVLSTPYFYYSHTYDLTHHLQALNFNPPDFFQQTLVARAEERFTWNYSLLQSFSGRPDLHKFAVPLLHGFVSINNLDVNSHKFKFIIISRRSSKRPGSRLFSRGVDIDGNVSNFVETEQIVECNGDVSSFVQVRGSIPLFWSQKPNLRYKPKPTLTQGNHLDALTKHFQDLGLKYSRVVSINLVDQKGSEGTLETAFARTVASAGLSNVRYEAFDFHHECRKMRWDRLDILMNRLANEMQEFGYFLRVGSHQRTHTQEGVFRTNCIDCLDRTNVVQGMLGRINLERVLLRFNILREGQKLTHHPTLEYLFKNIWADNGDVCSIEYSGTGALKTDFTRTGKRTVLGAMKDGYNSGVRYFKNNFIDGHKQDAMDLFLGNYAVQPDEGGRTASPMDRNRDWKYYALPLLLAVSLLMVAYMAFASSEYNTETLIYMLFWGSMVAATSSVVFYYGAEYVDNPILLDADRLTM